MNNSRKSHCKRGHAFSKENTYTTPEGERVCKTCAKMHGKVWRSKNSLYFVKHRKAHKEQYRLAVRIWISKNLEYNRIRSLEWRNNNLSRARENGRAYTKAHPEVFKAKNQKRRTAKTQAGGSFTAAEWTALCKHYHNRCLDCGRRRKLTADHVVPVSKGGPSNISNIQPLCGPCNSSKGTKSTDFR